MYCIWRMEEGLGGDPEITYFDSTDNEMRGVERDEDDHQNQHQVEIQLPVKVSRTADDGQIHVSNSCKTLIGVHKMHDDPLSSSAYPMINHTQQIAKNFGY